jgi:SAM-dependent methyltransferase
MSADDIAARIARFARWHYDFDLDGNRTASAGITRVRRHAQRLRYLLEPLVAACGGTLAGLRVLDLGCNAGFWSLHAYRRGAAFVQGVDGRAMHVEQAELVFDVERADRARFRFVEADLLATDWGPWGPFDVVLCLGLLYHVNRPLELFARIAATGAKRVVVDTALSRIDGAAFEVRREPTDDPRHSVGSELVLWPTRGALRALAAEHGYETVELEPSFDDWSECDDYQSGERRGYLLTR